MRTHLCCGFGLAAVLASSAVLGCDAESGERRQLVLLGWNNMSVGQWEVTSPDIHRVELPNGFELGVRIDAAPGEMYADAWKDRRHAPEMVRISLYDVSGASPSELTTTFGGANSVQGYGAGGGADRVEELGSPGITMTLLKPVCAVPESTTSVASAGS